MVYGTQITIVTGANLNQQTSLGGLTLKDTMGYSMQIHTLLTNMKTKYGYGPGGPLRTYYNYTILHIFDTRIWEDKPIAFDCSLNHTALFLWFSNMPLQDNPD